FCIVLWKNSMGGQKMANRSSRYKEKSPKKWWKITLVVLLVLVLGVGSYAYSIYHNAKQTVNKKMYETVESIDHVIGKKKLKETKPLNILLLGIDTETGDKGRSDAIMVLSLKPKTNSMQLISIPRDTRTEIVGRGDRKSTRLNSSHVSISYAVFCLTNKKETTTNT